MIIKEFEKQVEKFAKKTAVITKNKEFTYAELNNYANGIAQAILNHDTLLPKKENKQILGLLFEHSVHMIAAVLGTLKAGKAYIPLDITYPASRLTYMLKHSGAYLVLTGAAHLPLAKTLAGTLTGEAKHHLNIINIDTIDTSGQVTWENPQQEITGDTLAYILYTSGSTGEPKGVIQNHENVCYYISNWTERFSISSRDRMTLFSSFSHDGAGQDMFGALHNGATLYPYNILNRSNMAGLSKWLIEEKITIWHSVPTLYRYFVDTLKDQNISGNQFPYLRFILLGGEQLIPHDFDMFKTFFPNAILANVYGQTESSVTSILTLKAQDPVDKMLIGKPLDRTQVFVVAEDGEIIENLGTGEIVVSCKHIALGYWKDEVNTRKVFDRDPELGGLYFTGDFGRLLIDGNIEFLGRRDSQVKIRGYRVEVGEIESHLLKHEKIKNAVVVPRNDQNPGNVHKGDTHLCAYIVPAAEGAFADITSIPEFFRQFLSGSLPDYMLPTYFTVLENIPLTPNGKVDKKNLPEPKSLQSRVNDTYTPPNTLVEKKISTIWEEILNLEKVGIHNNFFELGGDSLKAMNCVGKIHREFNTEITILEIFKYPTIEELAQYIEKNNQIGKFHLIKPTEQKEYYDVSAAQKRLYILQQLEPGSIGYNLTFTVLLEGDIDGNKLDKTLGELINRHEILRTSFEMAAKKPVQRIHDEVCFKIEFFDLTIEERGQKTEGKSATYLSSVIRHLLSEFIRPFDLGHSPLMRIGLIKTTSTRHIFMLDIHHIVFDGTSINILFEELMSLYRGKKLPAIQVQYKDYWEWQNRLEDKRIRKRQEDYWTNVFAGEVPVINLPTDYPRPSVQSFEGNQLNFVIGRKETDDLKAVAKEEEVTLFMVLLAVINVLLMKLSGQEDIVIGIPVSGRRHPDSEKIVGMFINTLALRNYPANQKIFREFLGEIKERTLNALEKQDYPFEDLVEKVQARRDVSRNPLFDVMFVLHNYASPARGVQELEIEGLKLKPYEADSNTSMFDMSFSGVEFNETLLFSVEYCTKLFKKETIERFTGYFHKIISSCQEVLDKKLSDIDILPGEEKNQLLHQFNNTDTQYPKDKTIHELFREQVKRTPDHVALVGVHETHEKHEKNYNMSHVSHTSYMSYQELNEKSDRLAYLLREKGIEADSIVGIMVERSLEMIVGIFGIVKAGGAYLPIDPDYPEERITYMLKDSNARILLKKSEIRNPKSETNTNAPNSNDQNKISEIAILDFEHLYFEFVSNFDIRISNLRSSNLAYIIYTSGTTGKPKGVSIAHFSLLNRLNWMQKKYPIDKTDTILHKTPFTFDVSVWEIFWWAVVGGRVCLLVPGGEKEPGTIIDAIAGNKVTIMHFVPSMLSVFLDYIKETGKTHQLSCLKQVIASGEALTLSQVKRFHNLLYKENKTRLANLYGPTEAAIDVSFYDCLEKEESQIIPIGKPIDNIRLYVLDKYLHIQPVGIVGELYIAGAGLARGYLNNPRLTAEKFINDKLQITNYKPNDIHAILQSCNHASMQHHSQFPITPLPHYPIYHTGDLSRWRTNGEIEFLGRIDHQVKIRGFRIEVEEIEQQLVKYNEIKEAVVTVIDDEQTGKYLAAYLVPDLSPGVKEFDVSQIREYLQQHLPDYMIPSYFVRLEEIPLTPNGKVDRKRLPEPGTTGFEGSSYQAPRSPVEMKLAEIWSRVLGIEKNSIGIDDNFFERGGHSLRAIVMTAAIHKKFGVMVPLAEVFKTPTIKTLARYITGARPTLFVPIPALESRDYYKLSINQKRLWIIQQLDPGNSAYNIGAAARLIDKIDHGSIKKAMAMILKRHESLRTGFTNLDGEPVQFIIEEIVPDFKFIDISSMNQEAKEKKKKHLFSQESVTPFDLSRPPLLRVLLVKLDEQHHELFLNMHHIVTDGWSMEILKREFLYLYEGYRKKEKVVLEPVRLHYKDFSGWQNKQENDKELKEKAHRYWRKIVETRLPALNLPYDSNYQRKDNENIALGSYYSFMVDEKTRDRLNRLAIDNHTTLFVVMFAAYNLLLSLISGQKEILCNIISAGRDHFSLQDIVGFFVNAIVVKQAVDPEIGFNDFLAQVKHTVLEAFQYQNYPLELVLEELNLNYPPVSAAFNMLNVRQDTWRIGSNDSEFHQTEIPRNVKFDMLMLVTEHKNGLSIRWNYKKACFKPETIEFISNGYQKLLMDIIGQEVVS